MKIETQNTEKEIILKISLNPEEQQLFVNQKRLVTNLAENIRAYLDKLISRHQKNITNRKKSKCPICGGLKQIESTICQTCFNKGVDWVHSQGWNYPGWMGEPHDPNLKNPYDYRS